MASSETMTNQRVQLFSPTFTEFITIDAIIDTGADVCVIPVHIAALLGTEPGKTASHMWQVRDPLTLRDTHIRLAWPGHDHEVEAELLEIPVEYRREATAEEHCTRPQFAHPLTTQIIIGHNFLSLLPDDARRQLLDPTA